METDNLYDGPNLCPFCRKLFMQEKALYRHIVTAHADREYMSYNLHADLYHRWQERIPTHPH